MGKLAVYLSWINWLNLRSTRRKLVFGLTSSPLGRKGVWSKKNRCEFIWTEEIENHCQSKVSESNKSNTSNLNPWMFYFTCCVCSIKDYTASTTELLTPQSVSTSSIADGLFRIILSRPMGPISPFPANEISDSMTRLICGGLMWRWILGFFANLRELAKRNLRCFFHGAHKLWMLENFATFTKPQKMLRMKNCEGGFLFLEFFGCSCRAYLSVKLYRGIYMDMLGMPSAEEDLGRPDLSAFSAELLWVDEILGVGIGWIRSLRCFPIDVDAHDLLWISNTFCIAVSEHPVIWLSKNAWC